MASFNLNRLAILATAFFLFFALATALPVAEADLSVDARQSKAEFILEALDSVQLAIDNLERAGETINFGIGGFAGSVVTALGFIVKALQSAAGRSE